MFKKFLILVFAFALSSAGGAGLLAQDEPALAPVAPAAPVAPVAPALAADAPLGFAYFFGDDNFLGIYTEELTKENASRFGLKEPRAGVGVARVVKDSPAERAGLKENDVLVRFDGEPVSNARKLNRLIDESAPGHTARLTVLRGGAEREVTVTLEAGRGMGALRRGEIFTPERMEEWRKQGEEWKKNSERWQKDSEEWRRQAERMRPQIEGAMRDGMGVFSATFGAGRRIGVSTNTLTEQLGEYFGVERGRRGVLVTSVEADSPASKAGLKAGDVVTEADGERIEQTGDLARAISRKKDGDVTLTVVRDKNKRTVKVTPEAAPTPRFELYSDAWPHVAPVVPVAPVAPRVAPAPRTPRAPRAPRVMSFGRGGNVLM